MNKRQIAQNTLVVIGLSYIYFGVIPDLLSSDNTAFVALGGAFLVGTIMFLGNKLHTFVKGVNNETK